MLTLNKLLLNVTASDLMTADVVTVPEDMALPNAIALLISHKVTGAPVVDAGGRCVGALSHTDVARLALKYGPGSATGPRRPLACGYQEHLVGPNGQEFIRCLLAEGSCPYQRPQTGANGEPILECVHPHGVSSEWQVVQLEGMPQGAVRTYMTADPVIVKADTPIGALARMMIDAGVHRVFVVDEQSRPVGIVSSTDIMAAVAYADGADTE
jgi:CBS domain-containing protein